MQRAFSVGGVISESMAILFKNLIPFMVVSFLVYLPLTLWSFVQFDIFDQGSQWILFVTLALSALLSFFLIAALTYGVFQQMRGQPAPLGDCISAGFQRLFPVFGVALVTGLLTGLGYVLFIVPGVILMCMWWVAAPVAVVEGKGIGESMSRSAELTKGSRGAVFGIVFLLGLLSGVAVFVITLALPATHEAVIENGEIVINSNAFSIMVTQVVSAFFSAWGACAAAVGYHDLRATKENVDIQSIAAVFD